mgnify:CR=1 FL=1
MKKIENSLRAMKWQRPTNLVHFGDRPKGGPANQVLLPADLSPEDLGIRVRFSKKHSYELTRLYMKCLVKQVKKIVFRPIFISI